MKREESDRLLPCLLEWNHFGRALGVRWNDGVFEVMRGNPGCENPAGIRAEDLLSDETAWADYEDHRVADWRMFLDDETGEYLLRLEVSVVESSSFNKVSVMDADWKRTYWRIAPRCMAEDIASHPNVHQSGGAEAPHNR